MIDIKHLTPAKKVLAFIVLTIGTFFICLLLVFILGLILGTTWDNIWLRSLQVSLPPILLHAYWTFFSKKKQELNLIS